MKTTKKDFITGAVVITIVLAAMVNAAPEPISEMETTPRNCCCCCCCQNKDEVIYTSDDAQQEPSTYPVGEPPPRPVILSR
mgnify:FL=1